MAEIMPIWRKTLSNQSIKQSINQSINQSIHVIIVILHIGVHLSSLRKEGFIYTEKINQQYRF